VIPIAKPYLTESEAKAAHDTILSGWITQGPKVQEFEEKFAKYVSAPHAIAVSNCTTALHLVMIVAGIGKGDEVVCPSMSYIATANAITYTGATPVFAEVNNDYNIDIEHVKTIITSKTKAILIVHQVGMPADIDAFKELCSKKGLLLIEDAACAIGSIYKGKKVGSHSDLVCFSFHPRKVISTGDGGMITTSNEAFSKRLKLLRQHGMSVSDRVRHSSSKIIFEEHVEVGYNYRLTDIQASVGIKQLEKLDWLIEERRKIASFYIDKLKNIDCIKLPLEDLVNTRSNYQSFSIYLKKNCPVSRDELMQKMLDNGIATRRGIMCSHREPAYKNKGVNISLQVSEDLQDNSILIPLYVPMSDEDRNTVAEIFIDCLRKD
jgi:perosamine synthetase